MIQASECTVNFAFNLTLKCDNILLVSYRGSVFFAHSVVSFLYVNTRPPYITFTYCLYLFVCPWTHRVLNTVYCLSHEAWRLHKCVCGRSDPLQKDKCGSVRNDQLQHLWISLMCISSVGFLIKVRLHMPVAALPQCMVVIDGAIVTSWLGWRFSGRQQSTVQSHLTVFDCRISCTIERRQSVFHCKSIKSFPSSITFALL